MSIVGLYAHPASCVGVPETVDCTITLPETQEQSTKIRADYFFLTQ